MPYPSFYEVDVPTIPTNGAEDTYNEFETIYDQKLLDRLATLAVNTARLAAPDIDEADIWASGFSESGYAPDELDATDQHKLDRQSAAGDPADADPDQEWRFDGDDSNERNIIGRDIHKLREDKLAVGRRMAELEATSRLTETERAKGVEELAELDRQIREKQELQTASTLPVYFATTVSQLREVSSEDNPLAYMGDVPGVGYVVLYDGRAVAADPGLRVSWKSDEQIRIAGRGADIMRHALAVLRLEFS